MVQPGQHRAVSRQSDVRAKRERFPPASRERRKAAGGYGRRNHSQDDADARRGSGQCACAGILFAPALARAIQGDGKIMKLDLLTSLYVFMLAAFIGFEVIRRVSPLLHTPLMSLTNALDAIAVVGAILLAGRSEEHTSELQSQSNLVCRL